MKTDIITRSLPIHGPGGLETATHLLAEGLVALGWDVRVCTSGIPNNAPASNYRVQGIEGAPPRRYSKAFFEGIDAKLSERGLERNPVISVSAAGYHYLQRSDRRPVMLVCHGTSMDEIRSKWSTLSIKSLVGIARQSFWLLKDKRMYRAAAAIVCVNDAVAEQIRAMLPVRERPKVSVIYNGVHTPEKELEHKRSGGSVRLVTSGRLVQEKGIHLAIESLDKISPGSLIESLTICGDGPDRPRLEALAAASSFRDIRFTGHISSMAPVLEKSDVLLLPSLRIEGLPMSVLEGLAHHCRVVIPDSLAMPRCQTKGVYTFTRGSLDSLVDAIRRAAIDETKVEIASELTFERMAQAYSECLKGLIV